MLKGAEAWQGEGRGLPLSRGLGVSMLCCRDRAASSSVVSSALSKPTGAVCAQHVSAQGGTARPCLWNSQTLGGGRCSPHFTGEEVGSEAFIHLSVPHS